MKCYISDEGGRAVPGLLPGGRIIIDSSPPPAESVEVDLDPPGNVPVYRSGRDLYIQTSPEGAEEWASASIQHLSRTLSGCDWCCGGGDQLLALYWDVRAACEAARE